MRRLTAAALIAAYTMSARPSAAAEYEVFIDVDTEQDLYNLLADGEISDETYQTLLDLLRRGIDLNRASREELYALPNLTYAEVDAILRYRAEAGFIDDPAALVVAGVLPERKLAAISAFLIVRAPERAGAAVDGLVRLPAVWVWSTDGPPPGALEARVGAGDLTFGLVGTVTRNRLGDVRYDPVRGTLTAEPPATRLELPKVYALLSTDEVDAIAGTYRIGFGQRLVFDNTTRYTPNGIVPDERVFLTRELTRACKESAAELPSPCSGDNRYVYDTPDFDWSEGLFGVAAGLKRLPAGPGWLQTYAFVSAQARDIYQYELYDPRVCDDPRSDADECAAPVVMKVGDDPLAPSTRFSYHTLPDMFRELIVGGNASFFWDERTHVGVTGYGADVTWLTRGFALDFQEWSRYPAGGGFGAVGVDAAWGSGRNDLFVEIARSVDSDRGAGGGFAAIARATTTFSRSELEGSLRYYDDDFANPYARPISAPDRFEGNRARDEAGARVKYTGAIAKRLSLRATADVWIKPSVSSSPRVRLDGRADYDATATLRPGVWLSYQNNVGPDESQIAPGQQCVFVAGDFDTTDLAEGETAPCDPQRFKAEGRLRWQLRRRLWAATRLQMEWIETGQDFFKNLSAWASVTGWATDSLRMHLRARYRYENMCLLGDDDFEDEDGNPLPRDAGDCLAALVEGSVNDRFERSVWTTAELLWRRDTRYRVRARYDMGKRLDDRDSTAARDPSPEHWLFVELEARF